MNKTSGDELPFQPGNSKKILYSFLAACGFIFLLGFILDEFSNKIIQKQEVIQSQNASFFQDADINDKETKAFLNTMHQEHPQSFDIKSNDIASVSIASQKVYHLHFNTAYQEVHTSKGSIKDKVLYQLNNKKIPYQLIEGLGVWKIRWSGSLYLPKV